MVGGAAEAMVAKRVVDGPTPTTREGVGVVDGHTGSLRRRAYSKFQLWRRFFGLDRLMAMRGEDM